jgi:ribosomal protein S11
MNENITLRTLVSPYGDTTKGSVLSQGELDNNFIALKGNVIVSAETINGIVTLKKLNGNNISFEGGGSGGTESYTNSTPTTATTSSSATTFAKKINTNNITSHHHRKQNTPSFASHSLSAHVLHS